MHNEQYDTTPREPLVTPPAHGLYLLNTNVDDDSFVYFQGSADISEYHVKLMMTNAFVHGHFELFTVCCIFSCYLIIL